MRLDQAHLKKIQLATLIHALVIGTQKSNQNAGGDFDLAKVPVIRKAFKGESVMMERKFQLTSHKQDKFMFSHDRERTFMHVLNISYTCAKCLTSDLETDQRGDFGNEGGGNNPGLDSCNVVVRCLYEINTLNLWGNSHHSAAQLNTQQYCRSSNNSYLVTGQVLLA